MFDQNKNISENYQSVNLYLYSRIQILFNLKNIILVIFIKIIILVIFLAFNIIIWIAHINIHAFIRTTSTNIKINITTFVIFTNTHSCRLAVAPLPLLALESHHHHHRGHIFFLDNLYKSITIFVSRIFYSWIKYYPSITLKYFLFVMEQH